MSRILAAAAARARLAMRAAPAVAFGSRPAQPAIALARAAAAVLPASPRLMASRWSSSSSSDGPEPAGSQPQTAEEAAVTAKLAAEFGPAEVSVTDISGGCGSMYEIVVVSEAFRGLSKVNQHRLVTAALREEVKGWHGLRVTTRAPARG